MKQVDEDAISFKPMGEKIHSYVRRKASLKGKGKDPRDRTIGSAFKDEISEDDPNAIVYEVYHVSLSIAYYNTR